MTPASPSWPSFRNVAWTFIPIFTFSGLTSISCEVSRTPSSIWTIAITYGFCISNRAGASWMTVYVTTEPLPLRRTRSIFPTDRRPHVGQTALGGKSTLPQLPHFVPIRLYRLWISRQKRGTAISVPPLEDVDDGGCAGAAKGVRQPASRSDDLALPGLPAKLPHDFDRLRNAGSADRLTSGLQATRRVDGDLAVQRGEAVRRRRAAFPHLDEAEVLDREDLGDREVVVHFGDLHVLRLESRLLERPLARDDGRVHHREIAPIVQRQEVARLAGAGDANRRVRELAGLLHLTQDDGRGAIGEGGAVEQPERLRDPRRMQHRLEGNLLLELGLGIQRAVLVILHRDGGHLFPRRVVLVHVTAGHHCVQAGERRAEHGLPFLVRGRRQDLPGLDLPDVRHLLRAADDHDVVHPGRDREPRLQERDGAARAAAFDADRRKVHIRQAGVIGDERGHVLLVDELPRGHVADVHRIDVLRAEFRVLDRLQPGLDAEVPERTVPEFSELRLADTDHGDVPHRSGLPHQDLPAVLRVRRVVDEDLIRDHVLDRRRGIPADLRDLVGHGEVKAVGACTAAVADREDAVARLGLVEDRAEADHDRPAVRVADLPHAQARVDLRLLESELLRRADGELAVRLVEHGVVVILRGRAGSLEQKLGATDDVLEVRRFASEASAVAGVSLAFAAPEVRRVRGERDGVADVGDRTIRPDEESGPSGRGAVLERVPGGALARVGTDREAVLHHLRQGQAHRRLHCGGPCLARELEVRGREDRGRTNRLGNDGRGWLDSVWMGFGADVDRADLGGVDVDFRHARPRSFDGDRDHVFVGAGHALRADVQPAAHRFAVGAPHDANVFRSDSVPRDVPAVAHDACFHAIRSSLEMSSPCSRSVRAKRMLSSSANLTARSSMFSGCTYTTIAGFNGWALIAIIGERPYFTPVKKRARSLVEP